MSRTLNARAVTAAKPREAAYYISDSTIKGLQLRVSETGSKSWSVRFRVSGQQKRLTLGDAAVLPLGDDKAKGVKGARTLAREALHAVANGVDPAAAKQARRTADTVDDFADTFITKYAKPRKKTWRADQSMLKHEVVSEWRHRPMKEITRRDVRVLLDGIVNRGAPVVANRVHSLLSKFFAFAITQDVIENNPVRDLPKPSVEHIRERVLSDDELRLFWKTTESLAPALQALWRIRLLTAKRPGEVANMKWQDVDLGTAWWVNPGTAEKNGLTHRVALSAPVVQLLKDIRGTATEGSVFAGVRGKRQRQVSFPLPDFLPKDLRKTAATYMSKHGVSDATIDAVLNHKKVGIIKVYNLHAYDLEKRAALDLWARTLTAIIEQKPADVLTFARA